MQVFTKYVTEIMSKYLGFVFLSLVLYIVILLDGSVVYIGTEYCKVMVPDINMEKGGF